MSRVVLMGSGETAPAMVKTHRAVLESCPPGAAVMLDTPYGFQVNADDLTARTRRYFAESVGREVVAASWRRRDLPSAHAERALALISGAAWLFAGPGSPTYALDQWRGTPVTGAVDDVVARGGTVVLGSAAAVTAGRWALPVYEVYKVGVPPFWAEGLDLLGRLADVSVAVIPHFDNNEGGTYDTRFCYLGLERLQLLQRELPPEAAVLGVDEHTAVLFDVLQGTVDVRGVGRMTIARAGGDEVIPSGTTLRLEDVRAMVHGSSHAPVAAPTTPVRGPDDMSEPDSRPSLAAEVGVLRERFDAAIGRRDVEEAVAAILALDDAMVAWAADTLQSDDVDQARRQLRAMVVRLGDLAQAGVHDPRLVVAPVVEAVLAARARARSERDYASSDLLRDVLTTGGVTVNDTPAGVEWGLAEAAEGERPDAAP